MMEPHLMVYYQVPLGGYNPDQRKHSYGFRMDRLFVESGQVIDYQQLVKQTPMFDLKMDHDGIKALNISGIDYLKKYTVSHADTEEEAEGETILDKLDTQIVFGLAFGLVFGILIFSDDGPNN